MRGTGKGSGGGVGMNKVVKKPVRTGGPNRAKSPVAVNQLGNHLGRSDAIAKLDAGPALPGAKLGNEIATNVGKGGPGKGRTIRAQGTQAQHGPAAGGGRAGVGEIFPGFGGKND